MIWIAFWRCFLGSAATAPMSLSASGVVRFHYPLIVPTEPEKCWIEIGGHHFFWEEGKPLVFRLFSRRVLPVLHPR